MGGSRRNNKKNWIKKQTEKQPADFKSQGREGIVKNTVRSYISQRCAGCHQQVRAEHIVSFIHTNQKKGLSPYEALWAFSRRGVFISQLGLAARKLGLDVKKADEAIELGQKKKPLV